MAGLLHAPLLMLTTLMVALNLSLSPMLVHTLQNGKEKLSVPKFWGPDALKYAVSKYNENSDDLYLYDVRYLLLLDFQYEAAGTKYVIKVILVRTICLKSQSSFEICHRANPFQQKICHFEVYVEKLENQMSLTSSKCDNYDPESQPKPTFLPLMKKFCLRINENVTLPFPKRRLCEFYRNKF